MARKLLIVVVLFFCLTNSAFPQGVKKGVLPDSYQKLTLVTEDGNRSFTLPGYFNGFNAQMMRGPSWSDEEFLQKVKQLHPKLIRYPGGTVASYWDWKAGWLKQGVPLKGDWKSIPKNPVTLPLLKFACDSTGAMPVFVLNMMTSTLADQMEMLRQAKILGMPVRFVELDNELYLGEEFYVRKFATGVVYAEECNKWISAIKKEFPDVKIAVVGNSAKEGAIRKEKKHFARTSSWNRDVLSVIKNADAMTFHVYGGTGLGYLTRTNIIADDDNEVNPAMLQEVFETEESIPVLLGVPLQRWKQTNTYDYPIVPEGMKVWITEYNLFEREGVVAGTWAHGLYALLQTMLFMQDPKTEMICYHNLTTSAQFAAIFNNNQGFAKAVKKKPNEPFDFTASGYCLSYFGRAVAAGGVATRLKFSLNESLKGARGLSYSALDGWVVRSKSQTSIMVVNLSPETITADFSRLLSGEVNFEQVSSLPHTQVASVKDVKIVSGRATQVKLLPYSATIIEGE